MHYSDIFAALQCQGQQLTHADHASLACVDLVWLASALLSLRQGDADVSKMLALSNPVCTCWHQGMHCTTKVAHSVVDNLCTMQAWQQAEGS